MRSQDYFYDSRHDPCRFPRAVGTIGSHSDPHTPVFKYENRFINHHIYIENLEFTSKLIYKSLGWILGEIFKCMYFIECIEGYENMRLFKKSFDESILTDQIFDHCKDVYEYDGCMRCQFMTLILLIVQARKTK